MVVRDVWELWVAGRAVRWRGWGSESEAEPEPGALSGPHSGGAGPGLQVLLVVPGGDVGLPRVSASGHAGSLCSLVNRPPQTSTGSSAQPGGHSSTVQWSGGPDPLPPKASVLLGPQRKPRASKSMQ